MLFVDSPLRVDVLLRVDWLLPVDRLRWFDWPASVDSLLLEDRVDPGWVPPDEWDVLVDRLLDDRLLDDVLVLVERLDDALPVPLSVDLLSERTEPD